MSNQDFNHYNVIVTGKILPGFKKQQVIQSVAKLFQTPEYKLNNLFEDQQSVLKRNIPHKKAYKYQQALLQCGAEVSIQRIAVKETEVTYSLVPKGEEQTAYAQLNEKIEQGEMIECNHCHSLQPSAIYCVQCGTQLSPTADLPTGQSNHYKKWYFMVTIIVFFIVLTIFLLSMFT